MVDVRASPEFSNVPRHADPLSACLHRLLVALIKTALVDDAELAAGWVADARDALGELRRVHEPGTDLDVGDLWPFAVEEAEADRRVRAAAVSSLSLPQMCPLRLGDLLWAEFDLGEAAKTIRLSAATG